MDQFHRMNTHLIRPRTRLVSTKTRSLNTVAFNMLSQFHLFLCRRKVFSRWRQITYSITVIFSRRLILASTAYMFCWSVVLKYQKSHIYIYNIIIIRYRYQRKIFTYMYLPFHEDIQGLRCICGTVSGINDDNILQVRFI